MLSNKLKRTFYIYSMYLIISFVRFGGPEKSRLYEL